MFKNICGTRVSLQTVGAQYLNVCATSNPISREWEILMFVFELQRNAFPQYRIFGRVMAQSCY